MDLATILGFAIAMGMVIGGALVEGLHLSALYGPTAAMIVVGGSIGATIMSHSVSDLKHLMSALKLTISPPKLDFPGTVEYLTGVAEKARKNGILSLQEEIAKSPHPIVDRGLTMAVDGSDVEVVKEVLESMVRIREQELHHAAAVCDTAGGYSPTIGILGTVMGMVHVMGNLSEPDSLGPAIAVAFLATLYGVGIANLVFLPLGSKIKLLAANEAHFGEMIVQGIIGLQSGENPRNLRERLLVFLGSHTKHSPPAKGDEAK